MTDRYRVRPAQDQDACAIARIYAYYVTTSVATFEEEAPDEDEILRRMVRIQANYPYLVVEDAQKRVVGFAYAHELRMRRAYRYSAEVTIYLESSAHHSGAAALMYDELESILRAQNVHNVYACITHSNEASLRFHQKRGYKSIAHFSQCGYKFDTWLDIIWMEKFLMPHHASEKPSPFIPCSELTIYEKGIE